MYRVDRGKYFEIHTDNCNATKRRKQQSACSCVPRIVPKAKPRALGRPE